MLTFNPWANKSEELFYQLGLRQFGDFRRLKLVPPPSVRELVSVAVDAEDSVQQSRMSKSEIVDVGPTIPLMIHHPQLISSNSASSRS